MLAHDVRASLAVAALVMPTLTGNLSPALERKLALARQAVARATRIVSGTPEVAELGEGQDAPWRRGETTSRCVRRNGW